MAQDSNPTRQHAGTGARSGWSSSRSTPLLPGLTILAHPELRRIGERCALPDLSSGREVELSRSSPTFMSVHDLATDARPRSLDDSFLSRSPIRLVPQGSDGDMRLWAEERARLEVDGELVIGAKDLCGNDLSRGVVLLLAERIALLLHWLDPAPERNLPAYDLVGEHRYMLEVRRDIHRAANAEIPVLVRGATGTGKELVAQALHRGSKRRSGPFVAVNLGAIASTLASAELFGVVKGAFTGADRARLGCFERAQGGTLFLDEIGEAPLEVQAHLLRALETGRILPVGAEAERPVDVRVVAATDMDLESASSSGRFREPLLHRLAGYEIYLPTLAERREDIGRLLIHFLELELKTLGEGTAPEARGNLDRPWLPASLVARLAGGAWPGNVRQLRNVARRLIIAGRGRDRLEGGAHLKEWLGKEPLASGPPENPEATPRAPRTAPQELTETPSETRELRTLTRAATVPWQRLSQVLGPAEARAFRSRFDQMIRRLLGEYHGYEVAAGENDLTLLFERPLDSVGWALEYQEALLGLSEAASRKLLAEGRAAIHVAELFLRRNPPDAVARGARVIEILDDPVTRRALSRLSELLKPALGRQILMTRNAFDLARQSLTEHEPLNDRDILWLEHGPYTFDSSSSAALDLFEVGQREIAPLIPPAPPLTDRASSRRAPSDVHEDEIVIAMKTHGYNLQSAADSLGISRSSLYKLVEKSSRVRTARDLSPKEIQTGKERFGDDFEAMAQHLKVSRRGLRRRITELGLG